jgi:hypothetical protein
MIDKYGDTVTIASRTKTIDNTSGDETITLGTPASTKVYIVRKNSPWYFDKAGLLEGGDAQMLTKPATTVNKDDVVAWNGHSYRIQHVLNRDNPGGNVAYKTCNLFLIS